MRERRRHSGVSKENFRPRPWLFTWCGRACFLFEKVHHCCGLRRCRSVYKAELAKLRPEWLEQFRTTCLERWAWRTCPLCVFYGVPSPDSITSNALGFGIVELNVATDPRCSRVAEVYDQLYVHDETLPGRRCPTAAYKDLLNPADLYVEMVFHESATGAGFKRWGCGKGLFVIKIALRVSTVVCRDILKFAAAHLLISSCKWDGHY